MKRAFSFAVVLLLWAGIALAQGGPSADNGEQSKFKKVRLNVLVTDASKSPLQGIMVQGQAVGLGAKVSLTDKDGRCGLELSPGVWVVKAIRLGGGGELKRQEIVVGEDVEEMKLNLKVGSDKDLSPKTGSKPGSKESGSDDSRSVFTDSKLAKEISTKSLDKLGAQAAAELSVFTDSVLKQARQKIIEQYASNRFSTSIWFDEGIKSGNNTDLSAGRKSYRLDLDLPGSTLGISELGRRRVLNDMLDSVDVLNNVPVYVNIDVPVSSAGNYAVNAKTNALDNIGFGNDAKSPATGSDGIALNILGSNIGNFLTGGQNDPGDQMGYEFSTGEALRVQGKSSFEAFYNEVSNHIVNLYRPLRATYTNTNQAISIGDAVRGVEFGVEKTFLGGLRANVHYSYSEAGGLDIRTVNLHFEEWEDFELFLENGLRHDLATTLEAAFSATGTKVRAIYRMYISDSEQSGFSDRITNLMSEHSRIDLSLQQRIDLGILSSARISFSLAVNNLLNNSRNSALLSTELEDEADSRKLLGGIKIEF